MFVSVSNSILIILIILILFTLYYLYKLINYRELYQEIPFNRVLLSNIYNDLKTGDLILYRSSINSFITDTLIPTTVYKHIGMIIRINGELYITESGQRDIYAKNLNGDILYLKDGVDIVSLKTRLEYYCGMTFLTQLSRPLEPEKENKLIEYIYDLYNISYPSLLELYLNFILNLKVTKSLYCFQYIYMLLESIGLISKQKISNMELTDFITHIDEYELNEDYSYNTIHKIIYDVDV